MLIGKIRLLALMGVLAFALSVPFSSARAASPPLFLWESVVDSYVESGGGGYDVLGDLVATPDGGLVAGGYAIPAAGYYNNRVQQPFLVRYDGLGNEVWRTHMNQADDAGYEVKRIRRTADGGFVVACVAWTPAPPGAGQYYHTSFLAKLDAGGAERWRHRLDPLELDALGDFDLAADGSIMAAGRVWIAGGGTQVVLLKLSPAGTRAWIKRSDPDHSEGVEKVAATADGGLYAVTGAGNMRDLSRFSPAGELLWTQRIEGLDSALYYYEKRAHGLTLLPDGGCAVVGGVREGTASNFGTYRPFLAAFTANGRQTTTILAPSDSRWVHAVERTSDGGMLAAEGVEGSDSGLVFVRYDSRGYELWREDYGRIPRTRYIDAIRETADGGFVASGAIDVEDRYSSMDSYLLKVEGDVLVGGAPSGVRIDVLPGNRFNPVNRFSRGLLPVAILSSEGFDATRVPPASVTLAGAKPSRAGLGKYRRIVKDVDGDRRDDLVLFFRVSDMGLPPGSTSITLRGTSPSGEPFTASDAIRLVGARGSGGPVRISSGGAVR